MWIALGAALFGLSLGFAFFDSFGVPPDGEVRRVTVAVVFTGTFERVDAGLQLLHAGVVPRLYISGVNANAGILPDGFVSQFSQRNPNIADLRRLVECCAEWGVNANNTLQNGMDTKCWADRRGVRGPLLLITSRLHMARALDALLIALPGREIIPYPIDDPLSRVDDTAMRALEYLKYLSAPFARWFVGPRLLLGPFAKSCPSPL